MRDHKQTRLTVVRWGHQLITRRDHVRALLGLCEYAGRVCYKSEQKIRQGSDQTFIGRLVRHGHESVIEHGSITVKIICDRACSHQLVRHRIAAYSQESQRYCDYGGTGLTVICPPRIAELPPGRYELCWLGADHHCEWWRVDDVNLKERLLGSAELSRANRWLDHKLACYRLYCDFRDEGIPPEDARSVLPNATKTEVVTTYNLRQWRHVFEHRALNPRAQWEIRLIMQGILAEFAGLLPAVFAEQAERIEGVGK